MLSMYSLINTNRIRLIATCTQRMQPSLPSTPNAANGHLRVEAPIPFAFGRILGCISARVELFRSDDGDRALAQGNISGTPRPSRLPFSTATLFGSMFGT